MSHPPTDQYPDFLQSYDLLKQHFDANLDFLSNTKKGNKFADFSRRIIPFCDDIRIDIKSDDLTLRQASHDQGVDIEGLTSSNQYIYGQSKYSILQIDHIDSIFSKFQDFDTKQHGIQNQRQLSMFDSDKEEEINYVIITLSNISNLLKKYENSTRPSTKFYQILKSQNRLYIIDGNKILTTLRKLYRKSHVLPSCIDLTLENKPLHQDNVYIGIVSAQTIKEIYDQHGDSLFLENIRDFLGFTDKLSEDEQKKTVNEAIVTTVKFEPHKMLARNNGITFRAERVESINDTVLQLNSASIVNGCQTTMCMLQNPIKKVCVMVKIVETEDSWDIAKSANFQNEVKQIKLELASCIRPQVVKGAVSRIGGVKIESSSNSAFDVLDSIYESTIVYDGIYAIFSGVFSSNSSNIMNADYNGLRSDLLRDFLQYEHKDIVFEILFEVYKASEKALQQLKERQTGETYNQLWQRFWREKNYNYKAFLTILAICGATQVLIYGKSSSITNLQKLLELLQSIRSILENENDKFNDYYRFAFLAVATFLTNSKATQNTDVLKKDMNRELRSVNFEMLYSQMNLFASNL